MAWNGAFLCPEYKNICIFTHASVCVFYAAFISPAFISAHFATLGPRIE